MVAVDAPARLAPEQMSPTITLTLPVRASLAAPLAAYTSTHWESSQDSSTPIPGSLDGARSLMAISIASLDACPVLALPPVRGRRQPTRKTLALGEGGLTTTVVKPLRRGGTLVTLVVAASADLGTADGVAAAAAAVGTAAAAVAVAAVGAVVGAALALGAAVAAAGAAPAGLGMAEGTAAAAAAGVLVVAGVAMAMGTAVAGAVTATGAGVAAAVGAVVAAAAVVVVVVAAAAGIVATGIAVVAGTAVVAVVAGTAVVGTAAVVVGTAAAGMAALGIVAAAVAAGMAAAVVAAVVVVAAAAVVVAGMAAVVAWPTAAWGVRARATSIATTIDDAPPPIAPPLIADRRWRAIAVAQPRGPASHTIYKAWLLSLGLGREGTGVGRLSRLLSEGSRSRRAVVPHTPRRRSCGGAAWRSARVRVR